MLSVQLLPLASNRNYIRHGHNPYHVLTRKRIACSHIFFSPEPYYSHSAPKPLCFAMCFRMYSTQSPNCRIVLLFPCFFENSNVNDHHQPVLTISFTGNRTGWKSICIAGGMREITAHRPPLPPPDRSKHIHFYWQLLATNNAPNRERVRSAHRKRSFQKTRVVRLLLSTRRRSSSSSSSYSRLLLVPERDDR